MVKDGVAAGRVGWVGGVVEHQHAIVHRRGRHRELVQTDGGRKADTTLAQMFAHLFQEVEIGRLGAPRPVAVYLYLAHTTHTVGFDHLQDAFGHLRGKILGSMTQARLGDEHHRHHFQSIGKRLCKLQRGHGHGPRIGIEGHVKEAYVHFLHAIVAEKVALTPIKGECGAPEVDRRCGPRHRRVMPLTSRQQKRQQKKEKPSLKHKQSAAPGFRWFCGDSRWCSAGRNSLCAPGLGA